MYLATSGGNAMTAVSSQTDVGRLPGVGTSDAWEEGVEGAGGSEEASVPFARSGS